jgi:hypothetical protein
LPDAFCSFTKVATSLPIASYILKVTYDELGNWYFITVDGLNGFG